MTPYLPLIDRQHALVELQDAQVHRSRVDGTEASPRAVPGPAAVFILAADHAVEVLLLVTAPGQPGVFRRVGEQLAPGFVAEDIDGLRPVVVGVLVMAEPPRPAAERADAAVGVLEPF